jgi:hypothetical protein
MAITNQAKWVGVDNIREDIPLKTTEFFLEDYLSWQGTFTCPAGSYCDYDWDSKKRIKFIDGFITFNQPFKIEIFDGLSSATNVLLYSKDFAANEICKVHWYRKGYYTRLRITNTGTVEGNGWHAFTCKLY